MTYAVRGSEELKRVADRLKATGATGLKRELLKGIRTSAQKAVPDIQESARSTLPHTGGLNEIVASQVYNVAIRAAGASPSVRLQGKGMKELRDIDAGRLRHPVWGNRSTWVAQTVPAGFFTNAIARRAPQIRIEIKHVLDEVAFKIASGL